MKKCLIAAALIVAGPVGASQDELGKLAGSRCSYSRPFPTPAEIECRRAEGYRADALTPVEPVAAPPAPEGFFARARRFLGL